jgi:hypothetical protein
MPSMTVRTSHTSVTFSRPFFLSGIGEVQPAGVYAVVTEEDEIPGLSFSAAYRRIATLMVLPTPGGGTGQRVVNVDPLELQAAQEREAEPSEPGLATGPV